MAIFLPGQSRCAICNLPINDDEEATLFPHIILNELSPKFRLSDSVCHTRCVAADEIGREMIDIVESFIRFTQPGNRKCAVCHAEIRSPNDYFMIGYLGNPQICCLAEFNFTHLHRSHIPDWDRARQFISLSNACIANNKWRGGVLADIIQQVEAGLLRLSED